MKELAVVSGKGGTGKTTILAGFASLARNAVIADCDVDAANLHLILAPEVREEFEFRGVELAEIDPGLCTECGRCAESCRFGAIDGDFSVMRAHCEGCAVCELVCPAGAVSMRERIAGRAFLSDTRLGPMAHARLDPGEEASGMLVSLVRDIARRVSEGRDILIDGPPGIGCPVISTITGVDLAVVVAEPTLSSLHDLRRILDLTDHFRIGAMVVINRFDLNLEMRNEIVSVCGERGVPIAGELPYDNLATAAMLEERTIIEHGKGEMPARLRRIWSKVEERLHG